MLLRQMPNPQQLFFIQCTQRINHRQKKWRERSCYFGHNLGLVAVAPSAHLNSRQSFCVPCVFAVETIHVIRG
jgi:hypothetical protein